MSTLIVFANTNDAYLFSGDNAYATALAGPADGVSSVSVTSLFVGQQKSGTPYTVWQAFMEFGYTATSNRIRTSGYFKLTSSSVTGTSVNRGLDIATFDYGTLTTADWRTPAQLTTLYNTVKAGGVSGIQSASNLTVRAGYLRLTELDASATRRYVLSTSRNRLQNTPTGLEYNSFRSADFTGTASDPALYVAEVIQSRLHRGLGTQVQTSDGTHIYLLFPGSGLGDDGFTVNYLTPAGGTGVIATLADPTGTKRGAQCHALVRDEDDNLYVIRPSSDTENTIQVLTYKKLTPFPNTWSAVIARSLTLPSHDADEINNISATWHRAGGSQGTILAVVGHSAGSNTGTEMPYALLSCDYLLNGSGSLQRGVGSAVGTLVAASSVDGHHNFTNETGTLLDVTSSAEVGNNTGFVTSTGRHHVLGQNGGMSLCRYTLNSGGTGFSEVWNIVDTFSGFSTKDANAKARILPINGSQIQYVTVNASVSTDFGIVVKHRQQQGSEFTTLSETRLDAQGLTSMPSAATLSTANNWDAIYNPLDNRVWVYYFDVANNRRLMRTHVDLSTGQAGQDQVEVNATVGPTGANNNAIRVHRGHTIGEQMLISVANQTDGGTYSTVLVTDTINVAPSQPTLITRTNFDATTAALFDWDFNDLNSGDTQSAFELEIYNDTTGASAVDTGKVVSGTTNYTLAASALTNEQNWRWRVRTWDSHDVVSPWSDYAFFQTSSKGVVNITDPAIDNDPNIVTANYLLMWSVTNTTQSAYNIVITRTDTGATLISTGWIASTATQYLIQGMLSDIEWSVALKVRNAALIESNTAVRLITPNYSRPEVPIISFDILDELGYIQLNITNPEPVGDRPVPDTNQVQRRVYNATNPNTPWQVLGSTELNGTFQDYTAASGVLYEYRIKAIAGEFFSFSTETVADAALDLSGVWMHDPANQTVSASSLHNFPYGKDQRSTALDTITTEQQFAGRTFPVVDFGEFEKEDVSITVDIPHGPDHYTEEAAIRGFMEMRRTIFVRDNRGRALYGTMSGFSQADQAWGVAVGFKVSRVSVDIEEV